MERLSKTMDISGVATECGNRYREWHDLRHTAIEKWIKEVILSRSPADHVGSIENIVMFPEGSIGRHQLVGLQAFVKSLEPHRTTIVAGSHSFEFSREAFDEYPEHIRKFEQDPYYDEQGEKDKEARVVDPRDRFDELSRIASDKRFDIKQILPIVHSDCSISLRIKQFLSPFERTNTSQFPLNQSSASSVTTKIPSFKLRLDSENSPRILPLVCSEALQYLQSNDASLLGIVSNHYHPSDFKHLIDQSVKNGIISSLANDGAYGGSGVFFIHDNRAENWWLAGANHGALPPGDAILAVELDSHSVAPQTARANPKFPAGLAGIASIVPDNPSDPHCDVANELARLRFYFLRQVKEASRNNSNHTKSGIDYTRICDHLDSLIHSRRASPIQTVKLRRLLSLSLARNLDANSIEILCDDCRF